MVVTATATTVPEPPSTVAANEAEVSRSPGPSESERAVVAKENGGKRLVNSARHSSRTSWPAPNEPGEGAIDSGSTAGSDSSWSAFMRLFTAQSFEPGAWQWYTTAAFRRHHGGRRPSASGSTRSNQFFINC